MEIPIGGRVSFMGMGWSDLLLQSYRALPWFTLYGPWERPLRPCAGSEGLFRVLHPGTSYGQLPPSRLRSWHPWRRPAGSDRLRFIRHWWLFASRDESGMRGGRRGEQSVGNGKDVLRTNSCESRACFRMHRPWDARIK